MAASGWCPCCIQPVKSAARRLLARVPRPGTPEDMLRVALRHARAGAQDEARASLAEASGAHHLDDQVTAIVAAWPQLTGPLLDILTALDEDVAAQRLIS